MSDLRRPGAPVRTARDLLRAVVDRQMCIGCGACAALDNSALEIQMDERGRFQAAPRPASDLDAPGAYGKVCPFASRTNEDDLARMLLTSPGTKQDDRVGSFRSIHAGWAREDGFRDRGSSGGLTSWFLEQLLNRELVDAVLHVVASNSDGPLFNYAVSNSIDALRTGAKSRYYPVEMSRVLEYVRNTPGRYAIVAVPCFIKGIRLLQLEEPVFQERVPYCVGLFCGHLKSTRFADALAWEMGINPGELSGIDFRVEGQSADRYQISASTRDGRTEIRPNHSLLAANWGYGMFKYHACDFCDDVTAETADIAFGDAWLPEFAADPKGTNVVVVRSERAARILEFAVPEIELLDLSAQAIAQSQAAGLRHRREGLSHRLARKPADERPIKRVAPQLAPQDRRKIYDLRSEMIDLADQAYEQTVDTGDFRSFAARIGPWRVKYARANRVSLWRRIKRRISRSIRAGLKTLEGGKRS